MPDTKQAGTERLECIGIAGSGPSVGVTHFSLMTAAYLSGVLCRRTAVLEQNESGSFAQLEKIFRTGKRRKKPVIDGAGQPFEIRGIFFYQKAERAEWYDCSERGMEAMVIDFAVELLLNYQQVMRIQLVHVPSLELATVIEFSVEQVPAL